ncbi:hypothetical protein Mal64_38270 [Pseudobythopirellula maris]|uniref:Uncharacterized protein n=1 Tax=Pseudobythopirellula maris TaxID=2527991 RepID=A0A5C5ZGV1_9BACT|nr:hypothetical protein [Pseudobythopirellula maris]TWT86287.1 hypothetical protein Mal64_38270 [Pseudobythopirellula maris]
MPGCLFTFYAHSQREEGFSPDHQRRLIDAAYDAQSRGRLALCAAAATRDQLELLVLWADDRPQGRVGDHLQGVLERGMRSEFSPDLSASWSRSGWLDGRRCDRRLRNRTHYDWLVGRLAGERDGCSWSRENSWTREKGFLTPDSKRLGGLGRRPTAA